MAQDLEEKDLDPGSARSVRPQLPSAAILSRVAPGSASDPYRTNFAR